MKELSRTHHWSRVSTCVILFHRVQTLPVQTLKRSMGYDNTADPYAESKKNINQ